MISRLEHWLQDIVLEAIQKYQSKKAYVTDITDSRDPDENDLDYPSGATWTNSKTQQKWRLQKTWKKIPKKKPKAQKKN